MATCEMSKDCTQPVTHIGDKGYVYCATHAVTRRQSGHERCRKMRAWELRLVAEGRPLPSYEPRPLHRREVCRDCGAEGERTGHQTCQYPQDHDHEE